MKDKRITVFEDYPVPKAVLTLVAPSIVGMLVMLVYNLADSFFVGMLNDPSQTAAVSLAATVILAFNAVNNLFGVGGASLMGRALGEHDYETVRRTGAFSVWGAFFSGILLSLLIVALQNPLLNLLGTAPDNREFTREYLLYTAMLGAMPAILNVVMGSLIRAEGSALHASIGTASGCLLNIILDPFFILPQFLNMGAAGAGLATLISNIVATLYFAILILVRGEKSFVSLKIRDAIPKKRIVKEVFSVGVPSAVQNLLNVTGMTILNNFTSAFGSAAVSAMGISHKVAMFPLYISMGFSTGANPIIAYNYGSRNYKRAKEAVVFTSVIGVGIAGLIMVLYFVFSGNIISIFMTDAEVVAFGTQFLRGMAVGVPFLAMDFIGVGVYQAFGKGSLALAFAIGRKVILEIPALFILNALFPLYGLAWAQTAAEIVLGTVALFTLVILFRKLEKGAATLPSSEKG